MKNILVTGGAGFIGSALCEVLLQQGNKVIIIDSFNDYYDPAIKRRNIKDLFKIIEKHNIDRGNFQLYENDIRDKYALEKVFKNKIDLVIHLAAMAGVRYSIEEPELYYSVNVTGTLNLLQQCKKNSIENFIFASSSSVYGNNKKVPFSENDMVDFPISPYAATKKSGELLCHTYHHLYGISIACLRFFTVYGKRQRPDLAIHKFTNLILQDKEIPCYGDGSTERDYTYIDDIIQGILGSIDWVYHNSKNYEIFNLGGDKTISLNEMIEGIETILGKKAKLNKLPMQPGDVVRTYADIKKSQEFLKYNPKTKFIDGIAQFVQWKLKEANDFGEN